MLVPRCFSSLVPLLTPAHPQTQSECHSCSASFIPIFRSAHLCRFCGYRFCSNCAPTFVNGCYMGLNERKLRICQTCRERVKRIIKQSWDVQDQRSFSIESEDVPEVITDIDLLKTGANLNLELRDAPQKLNTLFINEKTIKNKLMAYAEAINQRYQIDIDGWLILSVDAALQLAKETKIGLEPEQGEPQKHMDIAKHVPINIAVIPSEQSLSLSHELIRSGSLKSISLKQKKSQKIDTPITLFSGFISEHTPAHKSMPSSFSNPRVIIVLKALQIENLPMQLSFEQILKHGPVVMRRLCERLQRLNPDIIFVEETAAACVLSYFKEKQVTIVTAVHGLWRRIKQIVGVQHVIRKLWGSEGLGQEYVGRKCKRIEFKSMGEGNPTLMFLEGGNGIRSVLLKVDDQSIGQLAAKALNSTMKQARRLVLEDEFRQNHFERESILSFITNRIPSDHQNILRQSEQKQEVALLSLTPIDFQDAEKNVQLYCQKISVSKAYYRCGQIKYMSVQPYQCEISPNKQKKMAQRMDRSSETHKRNPDMTLWQFLKASKDRLQKLCTQCKKNHQECYYNRNKVVQVEVKAREREFEEDKPYNNRSMFSNSVTQKSLLVGRLGDQTERGSLAFFGEMKFQKVSQRQKAVELNVECNECYKQIVESRKLSKLSLEHSFCSFIKFLTFEPQQKSNEASREKQAHNTDPSQKARAEPKKSSKYQQCRHHLIKLTYSLSSCSVILKVKRCQQALISSIDLRSQNSFYILSNRERMQIQNFYSKQFQRVISEIESTIRLLSTLVPAVKASRDKRKLDRCEIVREKLGAMYQDIKTLGVTMERQEKTATVLASEGSSPKIRGRWEPSTQSDWTIMSSHFSEMTQIVHFIIQILLEIERSTYDFKTVTKPSDSVHNHSDLKEKDFSTGVQFSADDRQQQNNLTSDPGPEERRDLEEIKAKNHSKRYFNLPGIFLEGIIVASKHEPVTVLAACLNSDAFRRECQSDTLDSDCIRVRLPFDYFAKTPQSELKQQVLKLYEDTLSMQFEEKSQSYGIGAFYHSEFEQLRLRSGISPQLYARSLCGCKSWDSSGGKSGSKFAKSQNELLVVKIIVEKQFEQFQKFAPEYLRYMRDPTNQACSLMAKIYGMYEVLMRGKIHKCIVMQNIFFGIEDGAVVYDLKGSQVNRLSMPPPSKPATSITGQDTNFKLNRGSRPYSLELKHHKQLIESLESDAAFLHQQQVIDYSLLVIETPISPTDTVQKPDADNLILPIKLSENPQSSENDHVQLRLGIIDFMRPYHITERLENAYKQFKTGKDPTVIPPKKYAERFMAAMKGYFIGVSSSQ